MYKTVLTAGFAMFSMFFGSGNLVFPLLLGTKTLSNYSYAMAGVFITAVVVPFLGLISMIAFEGNRERFFSSLGRWPGFLMTLMMLALIGPFGVAPRCITVAYGGLKLVYPELSFAFFSALFCAVIAVLIWRPSRVVSIIGLVLTPFKLGGISLLIVCGLYYAMPAAPAVMPGEESFTLGLLLGYQTMDLIAAFFFSAAIVGYLRAHMKDQGDVKTLIRSSVIASLIGALLLSIVYFGFVSLGAKYAPYLGETSPEALLAAIAHHTLGRYALVVVSITLAVSCLATATILSTLFVDFIKNDIADRLFHKKFPQALAIGGTMVTTYAMSLLGFTTICTYLLMVLKLAYPPLIALAIHHILSFWWKVDYAKAVFWGVFILSTSIMWLM